MLSSVKIISGIEVKKENFTPYLHRTHSNLNKEQLDTLRKVLLLQNIEIRHQLHSKAEELCKY
jgi:hypothetical protein